MLMHILPFSVLTVHTEVNICIEVHSLRCYPRHPLCHYPLTCSICTLHRSTHSPTHLPTLPPPTDHWMHASHSLTHPQPRYRLNTNILLGQLTRSEALRWAEGSAVRAELEKQVRHRAAQGCFLSFMKLRCAFAALGRGFCRAC